ncbi:MAG: hypothetical protein GDA49_03785 [Rhodospirillales bacterium]|nr:hypothetical protein [Rhodospirillales bacterium]
MLSVAGRIESNGRPSKHDVMADWMNGEGIPNDGTVLTWSSVPPGSR